MSGYVQRAIDVTIKLGKGTFGQSGFDTVKVTGLRTVATIIKRNAVTTGLDSAEIRIFGMDLSLMNQLSTLGMPLPMTRDNTVIVEAGDAVNGMAVVFGGTLQNAWTDAASQPDVSFVILGFGGLLENMTPAPPTSYQGSADVATIMSGLATQMGLTLENSGVSVILSNPYFAGTPMTQMQAAARAADINASVDKGAGVLAIWPKNGSRGGAIPLISPDSGLYGYPAYTDTGIQLATIYNPSIQFGGNVKVKSSITPANGTWIVTALSHELTAQYPDGPWFTHLKGYRFGNPMTLTPQ